MREKTNPKEPFEKMCPDCGTVFVGYGYSRCPKCQRKKASKEMASRRLSKRKLLLERNDELKKEGKRVCAKCYHVRRLSEFRTSQPNRKGKLNTICDRCLTGIYASRTKDKTGFTENFWRRKAYTVNTVGRARLAKLAHSKTSDFSLSDLNWECKPQDLAKLYAVQNGKCRYCGVQLTPDTVQVDHSIPLSREGKHHISNLSLSCKDCNMLKGTKTADEFVLFTKEYAKRFLVADATDKQP